MTLKLNSEQRFSGYVRRLYRSSSDRLCCFQNEGLLIYVKVSVSCERAIGDSQNEWRMKNAKRLIKKVEMHQTRSHWYDLSTISAYVKRDQSSLHAAI